jgi:hypothetical protein
MSETPVFGRLAHRRRAISGRTVAYDRCKLHHIIWWRNQGRTDLDNHLPVCPVHHTKIHHDGWHIELGPNRELTLTLPDDTTHTTNPPGRRTAAWPTGPGSRDQEVRPQASVSLVRRVLPRHAPVR